MGNIEQLAAMIPGMKAGALKDAKVDEGQMKRTEAIILSMTEKSPTPATHWCCPPFYYYTKEDVGAVKTGIESGCPTDAPGSFAAWLSRQTSVYAMEMPGKRYDIGNLDSYHKVCSEYRGITE